jgi:alanyl-tRNA synthetase
MQGVRKLLADNEEMGKELREYMKEKAEELKRRIIERKQEINGATLFRIILPIGSTDVMKDIAYQLKGQFPEKMMFVAGIVANEKPSLTVMLTDDLVAAGLHAGNLVREAAKLIEGGGGGQPHFATAGGKNADGLNAAVELIIQKLSTHE